MSVPDDSSIGAGFRRWVENWARGPLEERQELFWEEIEDAAAHWLSMGACRRPPLSQLDPQALWKAFSDSELQDLYDWSHAAGMPTAAERGSTGTPVHRRGQDPSGCPCTCDEARWRPVKGVE